MKKAFIGMFFAVLVLIPTATFLFPESDFSEIENRPLASAPDLSFKSIGDKSFMSGVENYLADHVAFRNEFVRMKTQMELSAGKREIGGVYIGDNRLIEQTVKPASKTTQMNRDSIGVFAQNHAGEIQTAVMLVPTAAAIYPEEIPILAEKTDEATYIQNFYKSLPGISTVDVYNPLFSNADRYIYYRTDHHWTSYGAYIGYSSLAPALGYRAVPLERFNIEHASYDFLGTLYSKVVYGEKMKDTVDLYSYVSGDVVTEVACCTPGKTELHSSVFFRENLAVKDKYTVFLGQNVPVVKIKTSVHNGKKLLIFKDSYANALMQFLPLHYEEIALVDLRYLNTDLEKYLQVEDYQQALFLYSVGSFADDTVLTKAARY